MNGGRYEHWVLAVMWVIVLNLICMTKKRS
jgi:hypothetical protein